MNAIASSLINHLLAIKPLAAVAKNRARNMMINRAESIGVHWRDEVQQLRSRSRLQAFDPAWEQERQQLTNADVIYPAYYLTSFHAYDEGNLGWEPALEVEVAARAVHARLWPEGDARGDLRLRQSYHDVLKAQLPIIPQQIIDLGCSVGLSTFSLQATFPTAQVIGVDLSDYFLTVAQYRQGHRDGHPASIPAPRITWRHAAAEATGLPAASADLVSICLVFHELPQSAAQAVLQEARRLLRPGGYCALMDMNPQSEVYATMPPYILTLLKSTEPYLDEYFQLDLPAAFAAAGFETPTVTSNTVRHRTLVARTR